MKQSFLIRRLFWDYVDITWNQKVFIALPWDNYILLMTLCLKILTNFEIHIIVYFRKYINSMPNYKVCIRLFFNKKKYLDSTTYLPIPDNFWINYCLTHSLGIVPFSIFVHFYWSWLQFFLLNVIILIWLYSMLHKY